MRNLLTSSSVGRPVSVKVKTSGSLYLDWALTLVSNRTLSNCLTVDTGVISVSSCHSMVGSSHPQPYLTLQEIWPTMNSLPPPDPFLPPDGIALVRFGRIW